MSSAKIQRSTTWPMIGVARRASPYHCVGEGMLPRLGVAPVECADLQTQTRATLKNGCVILAYAKGKQ